eukprot:5012869-Pleurochrysis_carterae.AAC.2
MRHRNIHSTRPSAYRVSHRQRENIVTSSSQREGAKSVPHACAQTAQACEAERWTSGCASRKHAKRLKQSCLQAHAYQQHAQTANVHATASEIGADCAQDAWYDEQSLELERLALPEEQRALLPSQRGACEPRPVIASAKQAETQLSKR